jgi:beta-glucanase (GH16 family)
MRLPIVLFAATLSLAHADPPTGRWHKVDLFSDEFSGTKLDPNKWRRGNIQWEGHGPAMFQDANVSVRDDHVHITMRAEQVPAMTGIYRDFTTGAVTSRARIRYGYFESRARPMRSAGSSAFWLYWNAPERWTEIDVFELSAGGKPDFQRRIFMNAHLFHAPGITQHHEIPASHEVTVDLASSFHTYGLEWDHQTIAWFFDGKQIRRVPNTHWHQALHVMLDSNTLTDWFGLPNRADLPSTFSVDYVRTWQRGSTPTPTVSE